jgi:EmrB/QacA subfamily drug resistance transporter
VNSVPDESKPAELDARPRKVTREEFVNLFIAVMVPMFLAAIDQTLLATATPEIAGSFGALRDSSWIVVAYLLAAAVIVPMYGRLGDRLGKRRMLLVAVAVFAIGSLISGLAQNMPQLIAGRVVQGLGGGGLMMLSHALIGELVPPVERIRFQAYFALMFSTASISGPVVGGVVVQHISWRWLFLANLPLIAFAAWRLVRLPPGEKHPQHGATADIAGHVLFAVGALSLLFWLTSAGHRFAWFSSVSAALAITAVVSIGTLWWHENRHASPFLPVELLHDKTLRLTSVLVVLFAASMFALIFFLPIYLQLGHRVSPATSGLLLLPVTAGQVIAAVVVSRILRRTGDPYPLPLAGMTVTCVGFVLLGILPPSLWGVIALGFGTGLGLGSVMPVTQVVVQTVAGRTKLGSAMANLSLARSTGGAAGTALMGAVVFALIPDVDRQSIVQQAQAGDAERIIEAFHHAFFFAASIAALGAFTAYRMPRMKLWGPAASGNDEKG